MLNERGLKTEKEIESAATGQEHPDDPIIYYLVIAIILMILALVFIPGDVLMRWSLWWNDIR